MYSAVGPLVGRSTLCGTIPAANLRYANSHRPILLGSTLLWPKPLIRILALKEFFIFIFIKKKTDKIDSIQ